MRTLLLFIFILFSLPSTARELTDFAHDSQMQSVSGSDALKTMYRYHRKIKKERKRAVREENVLACVDCKKIGNLAVEVSRAIASLDLGDNFGLISEVNVMKAVSVYVSKQTSNGNTTCDKRHMLKDQQVLHTEDVEDEFILQTEIPMDRIDAIQLEPKEGTIVIYFAQPPIIAGKTQRMVRVTMPENAPAQVVVFDRKPDVLEEKRPFEVNHAEVKKSRNTYEYTHKLEGGGFIGPQLIVDSHNLPKKISLLQINKSFDFNEFEVTTENEISTSKQRSVLGFGLKGKQYTEIELEANGDASIGIPMSATFADYTLKGNIGINNQGGQHASVLFDHVALPTIEASADINPNVSSINIEHRKYYPSIRGSVALKVNFNRKHNDQLTAEDFDSNLEFENDSSVWINYINHF